MSVVARIKPKSTGVLHIYCGIILKWGQSQGRGICNWPTYK